MHTGRIHLSFVACSVVIRFVVSLRYPFWRFVDFIIICMILKFSIQKIIKARFGEIGKKVKFLDK